MKAVAWKLAMKGSKAAGPNRWPQIDSGQLELGRAALKELGEADDKSSRV